jgi:Winged helix DNA-binding domain
MHFSAGKKYEAVVYVAPRVLGLFAAEGLIVRATNGGHWRINRPTWTSMAVWLGEVETPWKAEEGYAELVRRWLWTFGPGTEADLVWWLGTTKGVVRRALADVAAVQVSLDSGAIGWVLGDDVDPVTAVEPWAALLPVLDPTTMGWKERDHYLPPEHRARLFDSNGNAGSTAWWDGRVVGCWVQDDDGAVRAVLCEDVGAEGRDALSGKAEELTRLLQGQRVSTIYSSPLMKGAAG